MIKHAAIKIGQVAIVGIDHSHCIKIALQLGYPAPIRGEQGFVADNGKFYDRRDSLVIANMFGQIKKKHGDPDELYSEDLLEGFGESVTMTDEILAQGRSSRGGWSLKQLNVLGVESFYPGWKRSVLGKPFAREVVENFLSLKDSHLKAQPPSGGGAAGGA